VESPYGGRSGAQLTLMDALTAGYRFLLQPAFVVPILVIGLIVNAIVITAIAPAVIAFALQHTIDSIGFLGALIGGLFTALIAAIIGGLIINLYGQIWAVMASAGQPPTWQATVARISERWTSMVGAGLIVGAITLGSVIAIGLVGAALGGLGVIVVVVGFIVVAYVGIRLSMAGWIAADGKGAMESVQGSWEITQNDILLIIGWSIVIGIVVSLISTVLGAILGWVPFIGHALTQSVGVGFGFGAGVTLYRRVKGS
jgi:hypothetical protein